MQDEVLAPLPNFGARVLLDSVAPHGKRLTTFEIKLPKIVLAEIATHRILSRSSASSRAIPVNKVLKQVRENPYIPPVWGLAQAGMQATEIARGSLARDCERRWLMARDEAVWQAKCHLELGLHKQIVNRLLEPWMWVTVIVSATEWTGFWRQRNHSKADPALGLVVSNMAHAYEASTPQLVEYGAWHAPITRDAPRLQAEGYSVPRISAARCARTSSLTHHGGRDPVADMRLFEDTLNDDDPNHWGPMEHPATPGNEGQSYGNFVGWKQLRQVLEKSQPLAAVAI